MSRLFAPALGVTLLALLVGCGGGGGGGGGGSTSGGDSGSTGSAGSTGSSGSTGSTGTTGAPVVFIPVGSYGVSLSGSDNAATATTYTGVGTGTIASDGTITLNYSAVASGAGAGSTTRTLIVTSTSAGVLTGTLRIGSATAQPITSGTVVANSDGTYLVTITVGTGIAGVSETDRLTVRAALPTAGTYVGSGTGTDNQGASYTASGASGPLAANGALDVTYASKRLSDGALQQHELTATLLASGAFSGSMTLGVGSSTTMVTGTWSSSGSSLTLRLVYANATLSSSPTITETIAFTRAVN